VTRRRWLIMLAAAGVAIFALSFVNAWIVHNREVRGEGYRFVTYFLSAWRGVGMPVLTLGAFAGLATGAAALLELTGRRRIPPWAFLLGSSLTLGLLLSAAWPVGQTGHASDVDLSVGPLLPVGAALAIIMLVASVAIASPGRRVLVAAASLAVVALVGGAGARWLGLQMAEGTGRHWAEGSYERPATEGQPTETLTIDGESVTIGERWSGSWEWSGWTVVIADDPACPDVRGTYHAHGADEEDLRFVMVVDPCRDGERAADLETGVWLRQP
jgi:hypothetical protein